MALNIGNPTHTKRPLGFVVLACVLLVAAAWLYLNYETAARAEPVASPHAYEYKIAQSITNNVDYFDSSFYDKGPTPKDSAYVAELTNKINAQLHYSFTASRETEVHTMYSAVVTVRQKYMAGADGKDVSNVWTREYPLVKPVTDVRTAKQIDLNPTLSIPFADYRKQMDQFRTALSSPTMSEAIITFTVRASGQVDGTSFDDVRVSTVSMPLDQPVYKLATKFEKDATKQVLAADVKHNQSAMRNYLLYGAIVLAVAATTSFVYGVRKQIFKTPYQRQLDKIYRYHDGIIVKASKEVDLEGKDVVAMQSFDDLLNIEEELKAPIVASRIGDEATRFMIMHNNVVYEYVLGKVLINPEMGPMPDIDAPRRGHPPTKRR